MASTSLTSKSSLSRFTSNKSFSKLTPTCKLYFVLFPNFFNSSDTNTSQYCDKIFVPSSISSKVSGLSKLKYALCSSI